MCTYVIAGKADDPSLARAEYAARQLQVSCPNVYFHFEMQHPSRWKDFITSVIRKYDFPYNDGCIGPLVWTYEGALIGGTAEFVQKICVDKFGIQAPPSATDEMFKEIARENLRLVEQQIHREEQGALLSERCRDAHSVALEAGLLRPPSFGERRRKVVSGAPLEIWISDSLEEQRDRVKKAYGDGSAAPFDKRLLFASVGPQSHHVVLHPRPLTERHMVVLPKGVVSDYQVPGKARYEVPPNQADLLPADFAAAADVLLDVEGVATYMALRKATEYRHPIETYMEIFPFPIAGTVAESSNRYPLELIAEAALTGEESTLRVFSFPHSFHSLMVEAPGSVTAERQVGFAMRRSIARVVLTSPEELGAVLTATYEEAKSMWKEDSFMLAFTTSWLLFVPLRPPAPEDLRHELWLRLPPPPPCSLFGVVVCSRLGKDFPETVGCNLGWQRDVQPLVSSRAEEEGIPENTPEFEVASREVRIATRAMDSPVELMGVWALTGEVKRA